MHRGLAESSSDLLLGRSSIWRLGPARFFEAGAGGRRRDPPARSFREELHLAAVQPRFSVQVVKPSLESVLIAASWLQLAMYVQLASSCQSSVSKLVARWRMSLTYRSTLSLIHMSSPRIRSRSLRWLFSPFENSKPYPG